MTALAKASQNLIWGLGDSRQGVRERLLFFLQLDTTKIHRAGDCLADCLLQ
jgi:hypothetical protein